VQLWRPELELGGINSDGWYHCLPIRIYHSLIVRVNTNKTKVMISGERQKVTQKAVRWPCGVCGRGVVIIQYSALVVRNGYTRNVVVLRVACTK